MNFDLGEFNDRNIFSVGRSNMGSDKRHSTKRPLSRLAGYASSEETVKRHCLTHHLDILNANKNKQTNKMTDKVTRSCTFQPHRIR